MKKILLIVLIVLLIGAGVGGTIYFYIQNKNQIEQNAKLMEQNAQVQAQLAQIGTMTTVFQVASKQKSGAEIKENDLIEVSVPTSSLSDNAVLNKADIVGKFYKIDTNTGTTITTDLLMEQSDEVLKYTRDIPLSYLPVGTKEGDYLDFRMLFSTGEEYQVISHKRIEKILGNIISVKMSEEELQVYNAAMIDYGIYQSKGLVFYVTKYLEPGNATDTLAYYPVQHEAESMIMYNPNVKDYTRCVNPKLRDHIDYSLGLLQIPANGNIGSSVSSHFNAEAAAIMGAAQMAEEKEKEAKEGSIPLDGSESKEDSSTAEDLNKATGDAVDSIGESADKLVNDSGSGSTSKDNNEIE